MLVHSYAVATTQLFVFCCWCTCLICHDLSVFIDYDLSAATYVRRTVSYCFAALRQLRRYVTDDCFRSLVVSFMYSRLDYGNFVLVGLLAYLQRRLQSVLNAAARLLFCLSHYDHVSDALATLHWLHLPQRVDFKVAIDAHFQSLHGSSGTHCHLTSNHLHLSPSSVNVLKHSFFVSIFLT